MNKETAIGTITRALDVLQKSGQIDVSKPTDRAIRQLARACGIIVTRTSNARTYPDGYLSMSSIGVALGCGYPYWRNVQKALVQLGYLAKVPDSPQPILTIEGTAWGRTHDEGEKRWRVFKPEIVEHIRPLVERFNEAALAELDE